MTFLLYGYSLYLVMVWSAGGEKKSGITGMCTIFYVYVCLDFVFLHKIVKRVGYALVSVKLKYN